MSIRLRRRFHISDLYCPYAAWGMWHYHPHYTPPCPSYMAPPTPAEEMEDIKEHIEMLKEELAAAEKRLKELEKA